MIVADFRLRCNVMRHFKNFKDWSTEKESLHCGDSPNIFPKVRQIWFAKIGVNIGFESDGKGEYTRPILIMAKIGSLFWCLPLTSKNKKDWFHHKLESVKFKKYKDSIVMLSQARILDKKRLLKWIGTVNKEEFLIIQKKLRKMYFPASF